MQVYNSELQLKCGIWICLPGVNITGQVTQVMRGVCCECGWIPNNLLIK